MQSIIKLHTELQLDSITRKLPLSPSLTYSFSSVCLWLAQIDAIDGSIELINVWRNHDDDDDDNTVLSNQAVVDKPFDHNDYHNHHLGGIDTFSHSHIDEWSRCCTQQGMMPKDNKTHQTHRWFFKSGVELWKRMRWAVRSHVCVEKMLIHTERDADVGTLKSK